MSVNNPKYIYFDVLSANKLVNYGSIENIDSKHNRRLVVKSKYYDSCRSLDKNYREQYVKRKRNDCHMLRQLSFLMESSPDFQNIEEKDILFVLDFDFARNDTFKKFETITKIVFEDEEGNKRSFSHFLKSSSMAAKKKQVFYIDEDYKEDLSERVTLGIEKHLDKYCIPKYFSATGLSLSYCNIFDNLKLKPDEVCVIKDKENFVVCPDAITAVSTKYIVIKINEIKDILESKQKDSADYVELMHRLNSLYAISVSEDLKNISDNDLKQLIKNFENTKYTDSRDVENHIDDISTLIYKIDLPQTEDKIDWHKIRVNNFSVKTNYFDGEGLMSLEFCDEINKELKKLSKDERNSTFSDDEDYDYEKNDEDTSSVQFRLLFIKGCLHSADLKTFFKDKGIKTIRGKTFFRYYKDEKTNSLIDKYCEKHGISPYDKSYRYKDYDVSKLKVILTESQLKFIDEKYMMNIFADELESGDKTPIECFFERQYNLNCGIGINNIDPKNNGKVQMNYEFWSTLPISTRDQGFKNLAKNLCYNTNKFITELSNPQYVIDKLETSNANGFYELEKKYADADQRFYLESAVGKKFIKDTFDKTINDILRGRIPVEGQRIFLSSDLLALLYHAINRKMDSKEFLTVNQFYINKVDVAHGNSSQENESYSYIILRAPHYSRNEIAVLRKYIYSEERNRYFKTLKSVIMINPQSLTAERLGGADYDGDTVYLITAMRINQAVVAKIKNPFTNIYNYPITCIPSIKAEKKEGYQSHIVQSWKCGFDSRIGEISNKAFTQAIECYKSDNESSDKNDLSFYTLICGIDIDSKKTGLMPCKYFTPLPTNPFAVAFIKNKENLSKLKAENLKAEYSDNILLYFINEYKGKKLPEINLKDLKESEHPIEKIIPFDKNEGEKQKQAILKALEKYFIYNSLFEYISLLNYIDDLKEFLANELLNNASNLDVSIGSLCSLFEVENLEEAIETYRNNNPKPWHVLDTVQEKIDALLQYKLVNKEFVDYLNRIKAKNYQLPPMTRGLYDRALRTIFNFEDGGYKSLYHLFQYQRISKLKDDNDLEIFALEKEYLQKQISNISTKMESIGFDENEIAEAKKCFRNKLNDFMSKNLLPLLNDKSISYNQRVEEMKVLLDEEYDEISLKAIAAITKSIKSDPNICKIFSNEIIHYLKTGEIYA